MIEYKDILDMEWTYRRSLIAAKREWDKVVQYGKEDVLYQLRYKDVKELREAIKNLQKVYALLKKNDLLEYSV
jgi:hypothetical protein